MRLRKTNLDDLPQLKALWALGFGDTEQEIEAFFAISYPVATGFCAEEDGRLIAAAYALPQELAWGERTAKAAYLYAVTTHPDFRKQGVCRKLLAFAEKELKKRYFDCLKQGFNVLHIEFRFRFFLVADQLGDRAMYVPYGD